jgi:hypothetical protein
MPGQRHQKAHKTVTIFLTHTKKSLHIQWVSKSKETFGYPLFVYRFIFSCSATSHAIVCETLRNWHNLCEAKSEAKQVHYYLGSRHRFSMETKCKVFGFFVQLFPFFCFSFPIYAYTSVHTFIFHKGKVFPANQD